MTAQFISGVSGAVINGNPVTLTFPSASPGDYMVVVSAASNSGASLSITTSSGGAYTTLATTEHNLLITGTIRRWIQPASVSLQAVCSGTGSNSDVTAAAGYCFRFVSTATSEDVTTISTQATTAPVHCSSIAPVSVDDIIIMAECHASSSQATAGPTGFSSILTAGSTDTRSCCVGIAWDLNGSTNPVPQGNWTVTTINAWTGFSAALRTNYTWTDGQSKDTTTGPMAHWKSVEIIGYQDG